MQKVFSARDSMQAHIVRGMLEANGITARVDGDYLQGGIGELPLVDLISVSVDDSEYEAAMQLIEEFDRA
jgi:hypothetical protein